MKDSSNTINSLAHTKWNCKYHIVFAPKLAHTKWNCKYHIVFAPKYRRKVFYDEHRLEVREILRKLCEWKGVGIIEGEVCPDHVHMLVSIPPKMSVSVFMGYLKGKSATIIFQKWGNMKFAYRNHISKMGKYEIRIPKPRILVQGILCGYGREECESDTRICSEPVKDGQRSRPIEHV